MADNDTFRYLGGLRWTNLFSVHVRMGVYDLGGNGPRTGRLGTSLGRAGGSFFGSFLGHFWDPFFGSFLVHFWAPKWIPNGVQKGTKGVQKVPKNGV